MIFEKLGLCYAPQFASFVHDLKPLKRDPDVVVTDLHFGTIPVKLYQPKENSSTLRPGIIFFHGGGTILGSLSKKGFFSGFFKALVILLSGRERMVTLWELERWLSS